MVRVRVRVIVRVRVRASGGRVKGVTVRFRYRVRVSVWESAIEAHILESNDNFYIWKGPLLMFLVEFLTTKFAHFELKTAWVGFCNSSPQ